MLSKTAYVYVDKSALFYWKRAYKSAVKFSVYCTIFIMQRRIAVRGIVLHDNMLLCVKLKAYDGRAARSFWCTPGGGMDSGESLESALDREMREETGISPVIGKLLYIQQFSFEGVEQFEFFFHVKNIEDYVELDLSNASHAEIEISSIEFIDPSSSNIMPDFLTTENIEQQISVDSPTKIFTYL